VKDKQDLPRAVWIRVAAGYAFSCVGAFASALRWGHAEQEMPWFLSISLIISALLIGAALATTAWVHARRASKSRTRWAGLAAMLALLVAIPAWIMSMSFAALAVGTLTELW